MTPLSKPTCIFYARGVCRNGDSCSFLHGQDTGTHNRPRPAVPVQSHSRVPNTNLDIPPMGEERGRTTNNPHQSLDSRNTVPCRFFLQSRGCQKDSCPFLHVVQGPQSKSTNNEELELNEDEVSTHLLKLQRSRAHTFCRNLKISVGLSMEHQYSSMNTATFSRFRFLQTILLHASPASRARLPLKQSLTPCTN